MTKSKEKGRKVVIRTPFPSAEKIAKTLGMTKKEFRKLMEIKRQLDMASLERATRRLKKAGMLKCTQAGLDMETVLYCARKWLTKDDKKGNEK